MIGTDTNSMMMKGTDWGGIKERNVEGKKKRLKLVCFIRILRKRMEHKEEEGAYR